MNSFQLTKLLIDKVAEYEASAADPDALSLEGFQDILAANTNIQGLKNTYITHGENSPRFESMNVERVIAQHLLFMYRYVKFYAKMIFQDTMVKSLEEFSFMTTVLQYDRISKSDLIKKNVYEKSSGIEIINRLVKMQIFSQHDNPKDLRSQLIKLTDTGKGILYQIFSKMNTLGLIASGELSQHEKIVLAKLLKKLDTFHYNNYNSKHHHNLEDYLPKSK